MKKLLIIAPFCSLPGEAYFSRFLFLAEMLSKNYSVTLVTSSFRHFDKKTRDINSSFISNSLSIVLIDEPGYKKNVSLRRVLSHRVFFKNFKTWFEKNYQDFSIVYSAYPLISTSKYLVKMADKFNYKVIVDVQDVWPESISSFLPIIHKLPLKFIPFTNSANYIYKNSDALVSVSDTYAQRIRLVSEKKIIRSYIGVDMDLVDSIKVDNSLYINGAINIFYCGTLSYSYDLVTVINACKSLNSENIKIHFHIFGGGPDAKDLEKISDSNITFHGYVDYRKMISYIKSFDVAVNPIIKGAQQSITNKLSDYVALKLKIINSQNTEEVLNLLSNVTYENYIPGEVQSFCNSVMSLSQKNNTYNKKYIKNNLDRNISYLNISKLIDELQ